MKPNQLLQAAAAFHGHLGPWLALGLRAGRRATRVLGTDPFKLTAIVHCPARTPYTCFLDGVQFGSGCTLGKGNIRHVRSGRVWAEFRNSERRARLRLELAPEAWTELVLARPRTAADVDRLGLDFYRRPFKRLFIERPPAAR